jgi:hypothetical protein
MAIDLKKIKGMFVQQVELEGETEAPPAPEESKVTPVVSDGGPATVIDNKIMNSLMKAIQDNNLPGEDYVEFMEALKAMTGIAIDEKIKIQTVLATLSTKGLTRDKIVESATYYLKILENEKEKFNTVLGQEVEKKVKARNIEISGLEEENKKRYEKIAQLTQEIEGTKNRIISAKADITQADAKIKEAENRFNVTFGFVVNQINENIKKIKSL